MPEDETKRLILARRARFVALAVAGLAAACGGSTEEGSPTPCLGTTEPDVRDASTDDGAEPQPCLSPLSPDASDDFDADAGEPRPCLKIAPDAGDGG